MELSEWKNNGDECVLVCIDTILKNDFPDLKLSKDTLKEMLEKKEGLGVYPHNISKLFQELGYNVKYFTSIDWDSILKENTTEWDLKIQKIIEDSKKKNKKLEQFISEIKKDALWLSEHKEVIKKENIDLFKIQEWLKDDKKILANIKGNHLIIINGIDEDKVYYADPWETMEIKTKNHKDFLDLIDSGIGLSEYIVLDKNKEEKFLEYKENVEEIFDNYKEIKEYMISVYHDEEKAKEKYAEYLDSIFPDSLIKDIVYHSSDKKNIEEFKTVSNWTSQSNNSRFKITQEISKGLYISRNIDYLIYGWYKEGNKIYHLKINIQKPKKEHGIINSNDIEINKVLKMQEEGYDSIISDEGGEENTIIVFEPEQIHNIGSKKDLEMLKKFVENDKK